jgi:hypothetical protein
VTQFALQVDLVVFWLITASLANPNGEAGAAGGPAGADLDRRSSDPADAPRHRRRDTPTLHFQLHNDDELIAKAVTPALASFGQRGKSAHGVSD